MMWQHLKDFLRYIEFERCLSKNTVVSYKRDIHRFINFLIDHIDEFNRVDFEIFHKFISILSNKGMNANSIRRSVSCCKSFFRFLKKENIIKIDILRCVKSPPLSRNTPDILSITEITKLIEYPRLDTKRGIRDRAILELLYSSGLRVSELCDLRVKDFDFTNNVIKVKGKGSKERIIPFSKTCLSCISHYWISCRPNIKSDDFAFVTNPKCLRKLNRSTIWRNIKKYAESCGLGHKKIHTHTFRHCFANHLLDNGANISTIRDFLGHSDIRTTGNYLHLTFDQIAKSFYKYHPRSETVILFFKLFSLDFL